MFEKDIHKMENIAYYINAIASTSSSKLVYNSQHNQI